MESGMIANHPEAQNIKVMTDYFLIAQAVVADMALARRKMELHAEGSELRKAALERLKKVCRTALDSAQSRQEIIQILKKCPEAFDINEINIEDRQSICKQLSDAVIKESKDVILVQQLREKFREIIDISTKINVSIQSWRNASPDSQVESFSFIEWERFSRNLVYCLDGIRSLSWALGRYGFTSSSYMATRLLVDKLINEADEGLKKVQDLRTMSLAQIGGIFNLSRSAQETQEIV